MGAKQCRSTIKSYICRGVGGRGGGGGGGGVGGGGMGQYLDPHECL